MKIHLTRLATIAGLILANGAYAANKTSVTDSLSAGDSMVSLDYRSQSLSFNGAITAPAMQPGTLNGKGTQTALSASYLFGLTDRLNLGVAWPIAVTSTVEMNYSLAPNAYSGTTKSDGAGDAALGLQYLLMDKKEGSTGLVVFGLYSPASAASDAAVVEMKTNGVVTQAGVSGKSGRGYTKTVVGATLSTPLSIGDAFFGFSYAISGEESAAGVTSKSGDETGLKLGLESRINDKTLFRPYMQFTSVASGYIGTTKNDPYSGYDLGLEVIRDISKNLSVSVKGEYNATSDMTSAYSSGAKSSWSGTGYTVGVRGMLFFP